MPSETQHGTISSMQLSNTMYPSAEFEKELSKCQTIEDVGKGLKILDQVRSSYRSTRFTKKMHLPAFPCIRSHNQHLFMVYMESKFIKTKIVIGQAPHISDGVMLHYWPLFAAMKRLQLMI